MKRFLKLILIFLVALAALWLFEFPSAQLHYKLSVDVDDNGTPRHGEGVILVGFQSNGFLLIDNTPLWTVDAVGEAFAVDLGPRGTLFVLLSNDRNRNTSADAGRGALASYFNFYVNNLPNDLGSARKIVAFAQSKKAVHVAPNRLPQLVRFRDLNAPGSVEPVDPDHLDLSFGPRVKITSVRAELTNEPATTGIQKQLGWLGWLDDRTLSGIRSGLITSFADTLNILDF